MLLSSHTSKHLTHFSAHLRNSPWKKRFIASPKQSLSACTLNFFRGFYHDHKRTLTQSNIALNLVDGGYISFSQRFWDKLMLHKFASFLDSNRDGCGNCTINWKTAYHYALLDTPTGFFGQVVSTLGDFLGHIQLLLSLKLFNQYACFEFSKFILGSESICKRTLL